MNDCGTPVFIYLRYFLEKYKNRDSEFSLRAFARESGVSASALSKAINAKSKLSPIHAYQFASTIGLKGFEYHRFIDRVFYEFSSDYNLSIHPEDALEWNNGIIEKIDRIRKMKLCTVIQETLVYQLKEKNIQWSLQTLRNYHLEKKSESFILSRVNIDSGSVNTIYFMRNNSESYQALPQDNFNWLELSSLKKNCELNVKFTSDGLPEIYSLHLQDEERAKPQIIDLIFTRNKCFQKNISSENQERQKPSLNKVYFRV